MGYFPHMINNFDYVLMGILLHNVIVPYYSASINCSLTIEKNSQSVSSWYSNTMKSLSYPIMPLFPLRLTA